MHLAELNVGRLVSPTDDPRVAEFMNNIEKLNGLAKRMPGFVWMMEGDAGAGNTDTAIDGDPQFVPNLSVWESVQTLETYVWGIIHKQFYAQRKKWFEVIGELHFAMWWVPVGHRPTLNEALDRLAHLRLHGDSDHAFGWSHLAAATMHQTHGCRDTEVA
ncbi:MAG: DUF3291 domain-containing protein [Sulfitobacter sp.]